LRQKDFNVCAQVLTARLEAAERALEASRTALNTATDRLA
jgi:hypothetical protein